jgi:potassium efflux system protein
MVLAVAALAGLMGFVQLAWTIASHLAALIAVAVLLHFALGMLREALRRLQRSLEKSDPERAVFVAQNLLKPLYTVLAIGLLIGATFILGSLLEWNAETPIVKIMPKVFDYELFNVKGTAIAVSDVVLAFLILYISLWSGGWSRQVSNRWVYTRVADTGIRNSLATFTQYIVVMLGVVLAMKAIGLDLTALTVFAGALGVGIGFGMQQIVVNFISGILLLVERPLATTDLVNVDKYEGEVTRIGIRSLTVKTFDNQEVIIPNSSVITKPFTNWTRGDDIMRTVLMVGISYNDDPHKAIKLIKDLLVQHPEILPDPGPKALLWDYADSALMIRLQFHSRIRGAVGRGDLRSQVLLAIWDSFAENGITIPYPQRDVHYYAAQAGEKEASSLPPGLGGMGDD